MSLRPARENDCKLLFDWANEPEVRNASFNTEKIEWTEHESWYLEKIKNPNSFIFIFEVDSDPAGQIRFDRNIEENHFLISFLLDKKFRGMSLSTSLIAIATDHLVNKIGKPIDCIGFVKKDNFASQTAFKKNNFTLVSEFENSFKFKKTIF
ncbi:GNAT family N-acetyltransferase [Leptospira jelokensis]|uniref:GNAT family N-acetyltransferase n=1 Tax=Leptospira jelokensis TaxID=2484931 RepID=UPI001FD15804|nr:GNAT family N-acetyltransferase [Leptospira jelokensis]